MDPDHTTPARPDLVRVEGRLTECRIVTAEAAGRPVAGLTATVRADAAAAAPYGSAYHVTFPPTRDLDLWITSVAQAWAEAGTQRATPAAQATPAAGHAAGAPAAGAPAALRVIVWGELRCGHPIPPTGVRPATVLARDVAFPDLPAPVLARALTLWQRARLHRGRPAP